MLPRTVHKWRKIKSFPNIHENDSMKSEKSPAFVLRSQDAHLAWPPKMLNCPQHADRPAAAGCSQIRFLLTHRSQLSDVVSRCLSRPGKQGCRRRAGADEPPAPGAAHRVSLRSAKGCTGCTNQRAWHDFCITRSRATRADHGAVLATGSMAIGEGSF